MKKLIPLVLASFFLSSTFAQELKIFAGPDWAEYKNPGLSPIPEVDYVVKANPGLLFGLGLEFPLVSVLRADIGLQYFQKGTKDEIFFLGQLNTRDIYDLDVISLPVCLKLKPFSGTSPYLLAGGEISYVIRHHGTLFAGDLQPVEQQLLDQTRRWDLGLVMGGGVETRATGRLSVFAEVRYNLGLVNLAKPQIVYIIESLGIFYSGLRTRALALQAGIKFRL
ncbi:MAG: PorT family protein [Candidatus Aminicenantes bacterium]|nr:PorT family protein [Candidatus Aminicenantes bacterium]NTV79930.1 PorT family protein [Candidatus Aminicenantes bacterium]